MERSGTQLFGSHELHLSVGQLKTERGRNSNRAFNGLKHGWGWMSPRHRAALLRSAVVNCKVGFPRSVSVVSGPLNSQRCPWDLCRATAAPAAVPPMGHSAESCGQCNPTQGWLRDTNVF